MWSRWQYYSVAKIRYCAQVFCHVTYCASLSGIWASKKYSKPPVVVWNISPLIRHVRISSLLKSNDGKCYPRILRTALGQCEITLSWQRSVTTHVVCNSVTVVHRRVNATDIPNLARNINCTLSRYLRPLAQGACVETNIKSDSLRWTYHDKPLWFSTAQGIFKPWVVYRFLILGIAFLVWGRYQSQSPRRTKTTTVELYRTQQPWPGFIKIWLTTQHRIRTTYLRTASGGSTTVGSATSLSHLFCTCSSIQHEHVMKKNHKGLSNECCVAFYIQVCLVEPDTPVPRKVSDL